MTKESSPFWCQTMGDLALFRRQPDFGRAVEGPGGVGFPTPQAPLMRAGKPLALIVYLGFVSSRTVERDRMAELLWPSSTQKDARHSLRQALYRLRTATGGEDLVVHQGSELRLAQRVGFDCFEGERALDDGDLRQGLELLRGGFLEGFSVPGSREWEEWAETQRRRFDSDRSQASTIVVRRCLRTGQWERALELARETAESRPFDSEPVGLVMSALAHGGKYATALAYFSAHEEFLRSQGDGPPSQELYDQASEFSSYLRTRKRAGASELPFVGRANQWTRLEDAWDRARGGSGSIALIEGSVGMGKTRLVSEFQRRVGSSNGLILAAKCFEPEQLVPYGAVAEAFSSLVDHPELVGLEAHWLAEASRLLPEITERFPHVTSPTGPLDSEGGKRRLHKSLLRCLSEVAEQNPVLLSIDDVHWADSASLEALHSLAVRIAGVPVLLVVTYRPADLSPAARRFARSLAGKRAENVIDVKPLNGSDVLELLREMGRFRDADAGAGIATTLAQQSGGSPLFLGELLEVLGRDRVFSLRGGAWTHGAEGVLGDLPHTVSKLLADRVDRLEPWMRACIEVLAVAADELTVDSLSKTVDISDVRGELALSVLEEERLTRRTRGGAFDLLHDELRRIVYQGIPDERRRVLHSALGRVLESSGELKRQGGAARLAYHFDQADEIERARRYSLLAAGEAGALSAPDSQNRHLEVAAAHAPRPLPPSSSPGGDAKAPRRFRVGSYWRVAGAAAGMLGLGAVLTALALGRVDDSLDYRRGMLYVETADVAGVGKVLYQVAWNRRIGEEAELSRLGTRPDGLPPALLVPMLPVGNELHNKILRAGGSDTVQLTFGSTDDVFAAWSPDEHHLAALRGWRADDQFYQQNVFLLDESGHEVGRVTEGRTQDYHVAWSPTGTRLVVGRTAAGASAIWVHDADGRNGVNVTDDFDLPQTAGFATFDAAGRRIAVLYPDDGSGRGAIEVVGLGRSAARSSWTAPVGLHGPPAWSPDGRFLCYVRRHEGTWELWAYDVEGGEHFLVLASEYAVAPVFWRDQRTPVSYVEHVKIEAPSSPLSTGGAVQLEAVVQSSTGESLDLELRWEALTPSTIRIDERGFAVGLREGSGSIVASAGGFRADTIEVVVGRARSDTLFTEDWSRGLSGGTWRVFGYPEPSLSADPLGSEGTVLNANGDFNAQSGVVSAFEFSAGSRGLTVDVIGWIDLNDTHWQRFQVLFVPAPVSMAQVEQGVPWGLNVEGPSPTRDAVQGCYLDSGPVDLARVNRRWAHYAIQLRPDGILECVVDGELVGSHALPPGMIDRPFAIALVSAAEGTEFYHGEVNVVRGLLY